MTRISESISNNCTNGTIIPRRTSTRSANLVSRTRLEAGENQEVTRDGSTDSATACHEGKKRDEEEERRLFYVAMTRAKNKLYLTLARIRRIYGTDFASEPSQFLRDIEEELVRIDYAGEAGEYIID